MIRIHKKRNAKTRKVWCGKYKEKEGDARSNRWKEVNCKACFLTCLKSTNSKGYQNNNTSKLSAQTYYSLNSLLD